MKKILGLLALIAFAVVGAKFYLEYRYKKELDKGIQGARLFVDIDYEDLNVGFDGSIELVGLRVTPNGQYESYNVDSIKLTGLDLLFHFNGENRIKNGEFPKYLNFNVDDFSMSASVYEDLVQEQECKNIGGTMLYSSAGYDRIVADGTVEVNLADPLAASIRYSGSDQISRSSMNISFNARETNPMALSAGAIPVQSIQYDMQLDQQAAQDMLEHCAKKFNVTPDVFVEKVVKSSKFMSNSFGIDLGEKARAALGDFMQGGKELVVRSTPSDRLKSAQFAQTSSLPQLVRLMNLKVSLDGDSVPIRTFAQNANENTDNESLNDEESLADQEGFKRRTLDELMNAPDGTVQERYRPTLSKKRKDPYERATLSRVNDYIDRDVRITRTGDRSDIEGRLLGSEDNVLLIEIFRYGGVMTYNVPYSDIARFDVKPR